MTFFLLSQKTIFKIYFKSSIFPKQNAVVRKFEIVSNMMMMMYDVYMHTHTPVDSALRQVVDVHNRYSLVGVHDVKQCCDWLM